MSISTRARAQQSHQNEADGLGFDSLFSVLAFAVLLGVATVAPLQLSGFWPVSRDYFPQSVNLVAACAACLFLALSGNSLRFSLLGWLILAFLGLNALSVATSVYRHDSLLEIGRLAGALVWFFVARNLVFSAEFDAQRNRRALALLGAMLVGALWICALALFNFVQVRGRQQATFYNVNLFANYVAMALPLALGALLAARKYLQEKFSERAIVVLGVFCVALVGVGLLLSGSKGGLLAGAIGLAWSLILLWQARKEHLQVLAGAHKSKLIIGALLCVFVIGGLFVQTILPRLQNVGTSEDHSTMFRIYAWRSTFDMANARPILGHGPASFPSAYAQFAQAGYTRSAHESWLQIAAESGWISLLLVLAAFVLALKNARKYLQTNRWPFAVGCGGALVAFLVHGLTDSGWGIQSIVVLFALCLALLDAPPESENAPENVRLSYGWLLAVLPLAWAASYGLQAQNAENLRFQARQTFRQNPALGLEEARQATQSAPLDARMWTNLGQLLEADRQTDASIVAYRRALDLQPTRSINHSRLAQLFAQSGATQSAGQYFDRAVELDPNDTQLRLNRAAWLETLPRDAQAARKTPAFADYQKVVQLADAPYGRYPAIPEIVNLDFNRARLKLLETAIAGKDYTQARQLIQRGEADLQRARDFPKTNPTMAQALRENSDGIAAPTPDEIASQAAQFAEFKAKLP